MKRLRAFLGILALFVVGFLVGALIAVSEDAYGAETEIQSVKYPKVGFEIVTWTFVTDAEGDGAGSAGSNQFLLCGEIMGIEYVYDDAATGADLTMENADGTDLLLSQFGNLGVTGFSRRIPKVLDGSSNPVENVFACEVVTLKIAEGGNATGGKVRITIRK